MILAQAQADNGLSPTEVPTEDQTGTAQQTLTQAARTAFTGELIDYLDNVRKVHEQIIDVVHRDL